MRKLLTLFLCLLCVACSTKKPPLDPTQIVDGKSIIIPPEYDVLPDPDIIKQQEEMMKELGEMNNDE